MVSKIRVYGEAQNRTALGIVQAYMKLYPNASVEQLREAFPDTLAPDKGVAEIFVKSDYKDAGENYFTESDELINLSNGQKVAFVKHWSKPSYDNLVKRASDYGIEVAEFEHQKQVGKKGSYYLEYVNGYDPATGVQTVQDYQRDTTRRGCAAWMWWLLLAIIAVIILALLIGKCCSSHEEAARDNNGLVETTIVAVEEDAPASDAALAAGATAAATDNLAADASATADAAAVKAKAVAAIEQYQKEFDAVEYPVGEYNLKPGAKKILDNVVTVMKDNPGLKLTVNGYASREGNADANKVLSQKRADSVVDYLVSQGIAADRVKGVGLGVSNPVSGELAPNRRIDFVVE